MLLSYRVLMVKIIYCCGQGFIEWKREDTNRKKQMPHPRRKMASNLTLEKLDA